MKDGQSQKMDGRFQIFFWRSLTSTSSFFNSKLSSTSVFTKTRMFDRAGDASASSHRSNPSKAKRLQPPRDELNGVFAEGCFPGLTTFGAQGSAALPRTVGVTSMLGSAMLEGRGSTGNGAIQKDRGRSCEAAYCHG